MKLPCHQETEEWPQQTSISPRGNYMPRDIPVVRIMGRTIGFHQRPFSASVRTSDVDSVTNHDILNTSSSYRYKKKRWCGRKTIFSPWGGCIAIVILILLAHVSCMECFLLRLVRGKRSNNSYEPIETQVLPPVIQPGRSPSVEYDNVALPPNDRTSHHQSSQHTDELFFITKETCDFVPNTRNGMEQASQSISQQYSTIIGLWNTTSFPSLSLDNRIYNTRPKGGPAPSSSAVQIIRKSNNVENSTGPINIPVFNGAHRESSVGTTLSGAGDNKTQYERPDSITLRSLWRHRHARSAEEGIRREKVSRKLETVMASLDAVEGANSSKRRYGARTITGLINALAEEVNDLDVQIIARRGTPLWNKQVDTVKINFSRLVFKPLRMGGKTVQNGETMRDNTPYDGEFMAIRSSIGADRSDERTERSFPLENLDLSNPDEAFDRIDVDKSGSLDSEEIAEALHLAATVSPEDREKTMPLLQKLASDLVKIYDFNGDGVVDRYEYRSLVADMAALRLAQTSETVTTSVSGWFASAKNAAGDIFARFFGKSDSVEIDRSADVAAMSPSNSSDPLVSNSTELALKEPGIIDISNDKALDTIAKSIGSITVSDLKLDLTRILFGAIPIIKRITPGGPLVLEPFTVTINGSFNREDIMDSFLLDAGLRQLVARALRRRVGSLRDLTEGALFNGRKWKLISGKNGPVVEVPKLTNVEFDDQNRLILTGRARVQSRPDVPIIENAFKVRTKIGTRKEGRVIRLVEPELALVLECPESLEENLAKLCALMKLPPPARPKPLYSFFPIYSPFKVDDNDGFDLGEDNSINSIDIQEGKLCFELSAVLRPGRFLGSHYIAFTVPIRTFIVTLDRVREGIRAARKAKKAAKEVQVAQKESRQRRSLARHRIVDAIDSRLLRERHAKTTSEQQKLSALQPKSFFSRFVDGYLQAERDFSDKQRMTDAIRDFFGRQGGNSTQVSDRVEGS